MTEEYCAVCASELQFTAFGPCGHKETCSKCVVRLRFVMNDKRCVICQQDCQAVLVTRFNGEYTRRMSAEEFGSLQALTKAGELQYLRAAEAYFDDDQHFREFRKLCSYTHPVLAQGGEGGQPLHFRSLKDLRSHLEQQQGLSFCSCCLAGRKVFISEQLLYTKSQLQQHMQQGDAEGPMAEAGFKGHPMCKFCRSRFYGDQELYVHMQQKHEQCFLCKRERPDRYVYYRDYKELEEHFRHEHWLCREAACLAKHFVVFATEAELRQHTGREHGENMSKWERQQAMRLELNIQYRQSHPAPDTAEFDARRFQQGNAVVIGGGAGMQRNSRNNSRASLHQAMQASMATAAAERAAQQAPPPAPTPVSFSEVDFPATIGTSGTAADGSRATELSLDACSSSAYRAAASGVGGGRALNPEEFPALPGTSKAAKKRAKQKAASMAQAVGAGTRVVRASTSTAGRGSPLPTGEDVFPALSATSAAPTAARAAGTSPAAMPGSNVAGAGAPAAPAPAPQKTAASAVRSAAGGTSTTASHVPAALHEEAFPSLGGSAAAVPSGTWVAANSKSRGKGKAEQVTANGHASAVHSQDPSHFPALGAGPGPSAGPAVPGPGPGLLTGPPKVSKALIAANKALVERIKTRLTDADFASFRSESQSFSRGELPADAYLQLALAHGLAAELPSLMALLPSAERRAELLREYAAAFVQCNTSVSLPKGAWVPPESARAGCEQVRSQAAWSCNNCALINSPSDQHCEDCKRKAPPASELPDLDAIVLGYSQAHKQPARPISSSQSSSAAAGAASQAGPVAHGAAQSGWGSSKGAATLQAARSSTGSAAVLLNEEADFPTLGGLDSTASGMENAAQNGTSGEAELEPWERVALQLETVGRTDTAATEGAKGKKKKKQVGIPLHQLMEAERKVNPRNVWTQQHPLKTGNEWKKGGGGRLVTELRAVNQALSRD